MQVNLHGRENKMQQLIDRTNLAQARPASLVEQLRAIGVEPIPLHLVEQHKRDEVAKHPGNSFGRTLHRLGFRTAKSYRNLTQILLLGQVLGAIVCTIGAVCAAIGAIVWVVGHFAEYIPFLDASAQPSMLPIFATAGTIFVIGAIPIAIGRALLGKFAVTPAYWERKQYYRTFLRNASIPAEVARIEGLAERFLPGMRLEADILFQKSHVLDPVLWVVDPVANQEVAVLIWDDDGPIRYSYRH